MKCVAHPEIDDSFVCKRCNWRSFDRDKAPCIQAPYEKAARAAGWVPHYSGFTRCGVSIAYVSWKVLCEEEGIKL